MQGAFDYACGLFELKESDQFMRLNMSFPSSNAGIVAQRQFSHTVLQRSHHSTPQHLLLHFNSHPHSPAVCHITRSDVYPKTQSPTRAWQWFTIYSTFSSTPFTHPSYLLLLSYVFPCKFSKPATLASQVFSTNVYTTICMIRNDMT